MFAELETMAFQLDTSKQGYPPDPSPRAASRVWSPN